MGRFTPQRYESFLQKMIATVVTRAGFSDVTDTSGVKHVLAAASRAMDEANYQTSLLLALFSIDKASGDDLDARAADIQPGTIKRVLASVAVGSVVFSRTTTTGTISIPVGTQVKTSDGVVFTTTAVGTIAPTNPAIVSSGIGMDSGQVPVVAVVAGSNGNVVTGTVIKFVQKPIGVNSVTNTTVFTQGRDKETDDSFRQRIRGFIAGLARSTVSALESGVLNIQDPVTGDTIIFSKVVEDPLTPGRVALYVDDGTGTASSIVTVTGEVVTAGLSGPPPNTAVGGEVRLSLVNHPVEPNESSTLVSNDRGTLIAGSDYTLDTTSGLIVFTPALVPGEQILAYYTYFTGLIALAQKVVDGDPNDRTNYPGLRAAGIQVVVQSPLVVLTNINITLTVGDGYDSSSVGTNVQNAVLAYVNGLGISGDILIASIYQTTMNVPGVVNATVESPTNDINVLDNEIARITATNVTVS